LKEPVKKLMDDLALLCKFTQAAARTRCLVLAHKMLQTIYAMLANATPYKDEKIATKAC
jgi:hypothetical protein